jgi:hypothetical protein
LFGNESGVDQVGITEIANAVLADEEDLRVGRKPRGRGEAGEGAEHDDDCEEAAPAQQFVRSIESVLRRKRGECDTNDGNIVGFIRVLLLLPR